MSRPSTVSRGHLLLTAMLPVAAGFAQPMETPMGLRLAWKSRRSPVNPEIEAQTIARAEAKRARRAAKLRKEGQ